MKDVHLGLSVFWLSGVSVVDSPRDCRDQPGLMGNSGHESD